MGYYCPQTLPLGLFFFCILGQNILLLFTFYMLRIKKETIFSPGLRRNLDKVSVFLFDSLFVGGSKYTV